MPFHSIGWPAAVGWLTTLIPVAVQFVVFLRWLHRRMRNEEITRAFVRDIATNHLPHIYTASPRKRSAGYSSAKQSKTIALASTINILAERFMAITLPVYNSC